MEKIKVAFLGLVHVHASQMYSCMNTMPEDVEFIGMAE